MGPLSWPGTTEEPQFGVRLGSSFFLFIKLPSHIHRLFFSPPPPWHISSSGKLKFCSYTVGVRVSSDWPRRHTWTPPFLLDFIRYAPTQQCRHVQLAHTHETPAPKVPDRYLPRQPLTNGNSVGGGLSDPTEKYSNTSSMRNAAPGGGRCVDHQSRKKKCQRERLNNQPAASRGTTQSISAIRSAINTAPQNIPAHAIICSERRTN